MGDGKVFMEHLRQAGLLRAWVVARGTMIFAMRYGSMHAPVLPSGHQDLLSPGRKDMDIYVLTDDWGRFVLTIGALAPEFGFDWCGWQWGWPKHTAFCFRR